jgi:inosine-uridine nucleoside N-ribohydrolase
LKEGKNPISLFIENKIMEIVETNLPPKITKKDLVKYLSEAEPATAPVKEPKTKPGTKQPPSPVKTPSHPGKNPNPGVKEAPRAKNIDPEEAKEKIIDTIMKMLKK